MSANITKHNNQTLETSTIEESQLKAQNDAITFFLEINHEQKYSLQEIIDLLSFTDEPDNEDFTLTDYRRRLEEENDIYKMHFLGNLIELYGACQDNIIPINKRVCTKPTDLQIALSIQQLINKNKLSTIDMPCESQFLAHIRNLENEVSVVQKALLFIEMLHIAKAYDLERCTLLLEDQAFNNDQLRKLLNFVISEQSEEYHILYVQYSYLIGLEVMRLKFHYPSGIYTTSYEKYLALVNQAINNVRIAMNLDNLEQLLRIINTPI